MEADQRIELFQFRVRFGPQPENQETVLASIAGSRADICLFPEACTSGFCYEELTAATAANARFLVRVQEAAARSQRGVCLPLLFAADHGFVNRTFLIGPEGAVLGHYDKMHLSGLLREDRHLVAGNTPTAIEFPAKGGAVRIGLATCYDLRFPELFRTLVLSLRADVLLIPAMWPVERIEHFRILTRARALENLTPVVACNAVGPCGALASGGRSSVVSSWGELLFEGSSDKPDRFVFAYSRAAVAETRRRLPALEDARLQGSAHSGSSP